MSYSLQPHGLQHARPPCPLPTPGACSNSCPLSQWYHPTCNSIQPISSSPQSFPESGSLPLSQFFASGGQRMSFSFSISPSNEYSGLISFRIDRFNLLAVQGTLKSLLQHHSSKASNLRHSAFFMVQLSHTYMPMWGAVSPQETDLDLPVSVQESLVAWVRRRGSTVWPQAKQEGGNTAPPINRKLKIYWAWPRPSE